MAWIVELTPEAVDNLKKIGTADAKRILKFLHNRLLHHDNPRAIGDRLQGSLREFWRYRVGNYRILCRLEDAIITVFVVSIGHRRDVYKR